MVNPVGLSLDMVLVLTTLAIASVLLISDAIRVDVAAVLVLVTLGIFKLLPPEQLFSGFSSEAVISLIAIMIMSAGLDATGISLRAARWVLEFGGENPKKIIVLLMAAAGLCASFMRAVGTVALFMPIINRINVRTGINKSYLMLPMAYCAILGGMLTMVGSGSLIVLNSLLKNSYKYGGSPHATHFAPFKLFDVFPIGLMLLISGIIYLYFAIRKIVPDVKKYGSSAGSTKNHFRRIYGKDTDMFELKISNHSPLAGETVKNLEQKLDPSLSLICMIQDKENHFPPLKGTTIKPNALIAIMGAKDKVHAFAEENGLKVQPKLNVFAEILHQSKSGLSEAVIPPSSQLVGTEARELHMRRNYDLHVLAILRGDSIIQGDDLNKIVLRSGDTLGMFSTWEALADFQKNPDFFVLTTTYPREKTYSNKIPYALFFFLLSISLVVFGGFPISVGLLLGAVGMIATGVLSVDQAYEKVSWKTVFSLAGLIPLGLVMQTSGTAQWLSDFLIPDDIRVPVWIVESCLAVSASLLALMISNIGATVLMVPVAMDLANMVGGDPRIFALTVGLASASSFIAQSNQINSLIAGPGGYTSRQFFIIGSGMTIIYLIVVVVGIQLFF